MFGSKPKKEIVEIPTIQVQTMPSDFYGGVNPVVKFKQVEKEVMWKEKGNELTGSEKKMMDKAGVVGGGQKLHPSNLFSNNKFVLFGSIAIFLITVAAISAYYWYDAKKSAISVAPKVDMSVLTLVVSSTISDNALPATTTIETVTTTIETTTLSNNGEVLPDFPSTLLSKGVDLDNDGLSDKEELVFFTDPSIVDTDKDAYTDGQEVYYLYNPSGLAPVKMIDATSTVLEYTNPTYGYKIYYPYNWVTAAVDQKYADIFITEINGENIEVRVFDLDANTATFSDWFGKWAPKEKYSDLVDFSSRFNEKGKKRSDGLVYYFFDGNRVYLILYHNIPYSNIAEYTGVLQMVARSFQLSGNTIMINGQSPNESNSTTTNTSEATTTPSSTSGSANETSAKKVSSTESLITNTSTMNNISSSTSSTIEQ